MIRIVVFGLLLLHLVGCGDSNESNVTTLQTTTSKLSVDITISWINMTSTPSGATLIFYPRDGSSQYLLTNETQDNIKLAKGIYDVLVINGTTDTHPYIRFEGIDQYSTFSAYWSDTTDNKVENTDDILAVARLVDVVISETMISSETPLTLTFVPQIVNATMNFSFNVDQISNISTTNSSYMSVTGMASGYNLATGLPTGEVVTHRSDLGDRVYNEDGSGTMSTTFYVFGKGEDISRSSITNELSLTFALKNNEVQEVAAIDITSVIAQIVPEPEEVAQPDTSVDPEQVYVPETTPDEPEPDPVVETTITVSESGVVAEVEGDVIVEEQIEIPEMTLENVPDLESEGGVDAAPDGWGDVIVIPLS